MDLNQSGFGAVPLFVRILIQLKEVVQVQVVQ